MLIGDPSLGFFPPAALPPGVPGDVSTARFTGTTKTPTYGTKLKGITVLGTAVVVGLGTALIKYEGSWGGPLADLNVGSITASTSLSAYGEITSAKIAYPTGCRIYWTNTSEYAYSGVIGFNALGTPTSVGTNTSFASRIPNLCDMMWDRYGEFCYMTDCGSGKSVTRFDMAALDIAATPTPPYMDSICTAAYGTPYCSHINLGGTKFWIAVKKSNGRCVVLQYDLPTAYSLAGAVLSKTSPELEAGIVIPSGLCLFNDSAVRADAWMLVGDRDSKTIYEYSMSP